MRPAGSGRRRRRRSTGAPPRATGASTRGPPKPTDEEKAEVGRLRTRQDELANLDEEDWTDELATESEAIEARLDAIDAAVEMRATFRREDFAVAGCIATVGSDGTLQVVQGLVKPEDMPKAAANEGASGRNADAGKACVTGAGRADGPAPGPESGARISAPAASPPDPRAEAREEAGVGIGLADDLRAIRTGLVKAHLARDFEAAFDLMVFQLVRAVFASGYTARVHALDIAFTETPDRPTTRVNDEGFAAWSPGEALLADRSDLPFEWMEGDDDAACFAALRALPRADKEKLFAAAVARTVKGQLAFEHGARPELEATVARLDIDFAQHVRPTAGLLWSRIRKDRLLGIARRTLGAAWASARSKYRKADLAKAMEDAFADGAPPAGIDAAAHAAALAWTMPGFTAFDTAGADDEDAVPAPAGDPAADQAGDRPDPADGGQPSGDRAGAVTVESIDSPAAGGDESVSDRNRAIPAPRRTRAATAKRQRPARRPRAVRRRSTEAAGAETRSTTSPSSCAASADCRRQRPARIPLRAGRRPFRTLHGART